MSDHGFFLTVGLIVPIGVLLFFFAVTSYVLTR